VTNKKLVLISADQLFQDHVAFSCDSDVIMIKSLQECQKMPYHKFRLAYLLSCMREFRDYLQLKKKIGQIFYYKLEQEKNFFEIITKLVVDQKIETLEMYEINDKPFEKMLQKIC
jgi:deoxyribodipyrimidine photolyase-like uncharacterized protein